MRRRDNFTRKTIDALAKRVGYMCSNPNCLKLTVGPSTEKDSFINLGVAAHITAASFNGPRYDGMLSKEIRSSINNGIWLCQTCSVLIDRDELLYTVEKLNTWKRIAEDRISELIHGKHDTSSKGEYGKYKIINSDNVRFEVHYILTRNNNLSAEYIIGDEKVTIDYRYAISKSNRSEYDQEIIGDDNFYFIFKDLEKELNYLIANDKESKAISLLVVIEELVNRKGIFGLAERVFDSNNDTNDIPYLSEFAEAADQYFGKSISRKNIIPLGSCIHVKIDSKETIIDSYEGLKSRLKSIINNESIDDLHALTEPHIWSEIYLDAGIEKHVFVPRLLARWESYWATKTFEESDEKRKLIINSQKETSWRQLQIFIEGYIDAVDIVSFSYDLDEDLIYPMVIFVMLQIFNQDICYSEYCVFELEGVDWTTICLNRDTDNELYFYAKMTE